MYQRLFIRFSLMLALMISSANVFADSIQCVFDVNDETPQITITPNNDIYHSNKIDLPGGFRLTAQYLPELEKFKAYIYHTPKKRYVLLSLQEFKLSAQTCSQDFGQHRIYDSADERELYFHCKRTCAK